jgi:molecular chaperone HtpG
MYNNWGMDKEKLQDLVMFYSVKQDKLVTFKEYVQNMAEGQKFIYYGVGSSILAIKKMPQTSKVLDSGYDVLCMTDNVDEFAIKYLGAYDQKEFKNVTGGDTGIENEADTVSEEDKPILEFTPSGIILHSNPWCGKEGIYTKTTAKLNAICIISRAQNCSIEKISFLSNLDKMLNQIYMPQNQDSLDKVIELINNLAEVKSFELKCDISKNAFVLSYEKLSGERYEN